MILTHEIVKRYRYVSQFCNPFHDSPASLLQLVLSAGTYRPMTLKHLSITKSADTLLADWVTNTGIMV